MPVRASLSPLKPGLLLDLGLTLGMTGPKDNDGVCEDPSTLSFLSTYQVEVQARSYLYFIKVDLGSGRNTR